jgi:thiamine biosynthesis lipoprotein ApbE
MKLPILAVCTALFMASCSSTKNTNTNLPKDIAERPADENSQKYDQAQLDKLKASIESEASKEKCTDANEWTFAPMGAKACGGPQFYIAYPKNKEATILNKINDYTERVKAFNQKYQITSDCMMINPPTSIKCVDGKAELVSA